MAKILTITDSGSNANLVGPFPGPRGHLINGKIVVSVAANNLTVAIKGWDGNDPSATNPVFVSFGNMIKALTAALSVTKAAATNWANLGSASLGGLEHDLFVYLVWNTNLTPDAVDIFWSRIPYGNVYGDFSATTDNPKYAAINATAPAATDECVLIGRFGATLSLGAGYTWTVPTFTSINLIQRPIYETRELTFTTVRTVSGGTAPTYTTLDAGRYKIVYNRLKGRFNLVNAAGGTAGAGANAIVHTLPFSGSFLDTAYNGTEVIGVGINFESAGNLFACSVVALSATTIMLSNYLMASIVGNDQSSASRITTAQFEYPII